MSVEQREPYPMPQPEQWLSEHPWVFPAIVVASLAGALLIAWIL